MSAVPAFSGPPVRVGSPGGPHSWQIDGTNTRLTAAVAYAANNQNPTDLEGLRAWRGMVSDALRVLLGCKIDVRLVRTDPECCLALKIAANVLCMARANATKYAYSRDGVRYRAGYDTTPLAAAQCVMDRLEGKPTQSISVTHQDIPHPDALRLELLSLLARNPELRRMAATGGWDPPTGAEQAAAFPSSHPANLGELSCAVADGKDSVTAAAVDAASDAPRLNDHPLGQTIPTGEGQSPYGQLPPSSGVKEASSSPGAPGWPSQPSWLKGSRGPRKPKEPLQRAVQQTEREIKGFQKGKPKRDPLLDW